MGMKTLHTNIALILLAAAVIVQSNPHVTPQVIYPPHHTSRHISEVKRCFDCRQGCPVSYARGTLPKVCLKTWFILTYV